MFRTVRPTLALALLAIAAWAWPSPRALAQGVGPTLLVPDLLPPLIEAVAAAPPLTAPEEGEPAFLRELPRPLAQPRSLFQPAPPPLPPGPDPEKPYFQPDPLLDPETLPTWGWFANVEAGLLLPHVTNQVAFVVTPGRSQEGVNSTGNLVSVPAVPLDWTVSPRFETGYRLPAGFGEFSLGYRFLATQGTTSGLGADGPVQLKSHLDINRIELDYVSREFSLYPHCDLKARFGAQLTYLYFDSRENQPFAQAAAGSGIVDERTTNSYVGAGPHAGLEVARRFEVEVGEMALFARLDLAALMGRIRQGFFETTTAAGPGDTRISSSQVVPLVSGQLGVSWRPGQNTFFFFGYQYEYWWNVGRMSVLDGPPPSRGDLNAQGIVLRGEFTF
jgi:hypothetical protein